MKLTTFNTENVQVVRTGLPCIGVNQSTGIINFNKSVIELMQLKEGMQVQFLQDDDAPENWYVEAVTENGFELRNKKAASLSFAFNSVALARLIGEAMEITGSYRMEVLKEPTLQDKRKLYGLVIKEK